MVNFNAVSNVATLRPRTLASGHAPLSASSVRASAGFAAGTRVAATGVVRTADATRADAGALCLLAVAPAAGVTGMSLRDAASATQRKQTVLAGIPVDGDCRLDPLGEALV